MTRDAISPTQPPFLHGAVQQRSRFFFFCWAPQSGVNWLCGAEKGGSPAAPCWYGRRYYVWSTYARVVVAGRQTGWVLARVKAVRRVVV